MFRNHQKSTGTSYTTTVAFIAAAILSPVALVASGFATVPLAIACSVVCLGLAGLNWRRSSQLSIPSLAIQKTVAK